MKTTTSKSTQIVNRIINTTTNDERMIEALKAYIHSSYHQGEYFPDVQRLGIDHYQVVPLYPSRCNSHLEVYFGNAGCTIMSLKKLKRWCRGHSRYIEDLFQNSYDKIDDRIETIIDQHPNDPPDRERLLRICKSVVRNQHEIDLQRAWKLFQEYATYIHPRTGRETCKMNLFQFTKHMER